MQKTLAQIVAGVNLVATKLDTLTSKEATEMATLDDIKQEVTDQTTIVGSVSTLLTSLSAQLQTAITNAAPADPTELQAIADSLKANSDALAKAVAANTPAAAGVV